MPDVPPTSQDLLHRSWLKATELPRPRAEGPIARSSSPSATSIRSSRRPRVFARNDIALKKNPLAGLAPFISALDPLEFRHGSREQLHLFSENLFARRRSSGQVAA